MAEPEIHVLDDPSRAAACSYASPTEWPPVSAIASPRPAAAASSSATAAAGSSSTRSDGSTMPPA